MKNWLYYGAGVITGIILVFLIGYLRSKNSAEANGIRYYEKPGKVIEQRSFKVFQVIADDASLVNAKSSDSEYYFGQIYVLVNSEGKLYYDDEIVDVPEGKVARAMGTYTYPTKDGFEKTVLIIKIMDN